MGFRVVLLCEKGKQAQLFRKSFGLNKTKVINKVPAAFYDKEGGICCVHLSGHLLELLPPEFFNKSLSKKEKGWNLEALPVIPEGERWPLTPKKGNNPRERNRNKSLLAGIEWGLVGAGSPGEIAIAVDNDKEGELLGWETLEYFKVVNHPNISRVLYSELTPKAMKKAFDARVSGSLWFTRYLSGLARHYCDWLVGMNVTMGLSLINKEFIPPYSALNSGRVVFAICYLFYIRELAVRAYAPRDVFTEKVSFRGEKVSDKFEGRVVYPEKVLDPETKQLLNSNMAEKIHNYIQKRKTGVVKSYANEKKNTPPPIGFHRTGLDRHLIKKFGLGLKEITDSLQTLYDQKGLVTYPRVDAKNLDESMHAEMPEYMEAILGNLLGAPQLDAKQKEKYARVKKAINLSRKSKIFKAGVSSGESHHAIIPTTTVFDFASLSETEFLIYREVADRLIIQFLPDYESMNVTVEVLVEQILCRTTGKTPLRSGWKFLSQDMEDTDLGEDDSKDDIPILSVGQTVTITGSETKVGVTTEPKHYNIPEILKDLESPRKFVKNKEILKKIKKLEIGTDGTRQDHINELEGKGLISVGKKKGKSKLVDLIPTKKLMSLVEIAPSYLKYPETSAYWEDAFIKIKDGEITLASFMSQQKKMIQRFVDELKTTSDFMLKEPITDEYLPCDEVGCGGNKFFKKMKGKSYSLWSCSRCKSSNFDDDGSLGKKLTPGGGGGSGGSGGSGKKQGFDWVPPQGTRNKPCPKCKTGRVYHKEIDGKKWSLWVCTSCHVSYFNKNGELGDELKDKKKGKK